MMFFYSQIEKTSKTGKGQEIAAAVCASTRIPKGSSRQLEFCLAWDMPLVHFGGGENKYAR